MSTRLASDSAVAVAVAVAGARQVNTAAPEARRNVLRISGMLRDCATGGAPGSLRTIGALALAALVCAGCETTPSSTRIEKPQPGERRAQFACRDGTNVEMRFFDAKRLAVLIRDGRAVELQQQASGSGFVYSNGPTTVRGKGREIMLEADRAEPLRCRSQSD